MKSTEPLSFDRANQEVEGMVRRGTAFARVEDAIDAAQFSRHHKAALWLLAWAPHRRGRPASLKRAATLGATIVKRIVG
jgi:hypothetical protein